MVEHYETEKLQRRNFVQQDKTGQAGQQGPVQLFDLEKQHNEYDFNNHNTRKRLNDSIEKKNFQFKILAGEIKILVSMKRLTGHLRNCMTHSKPEEGSRQMLLTCNLLH